MKAPLAIVIVLSALLLALAPAGAGDLPFLPQTLVYQVSYEDQKLNLSAKPWAQRVLEVEQPASSTVTIMPFDVQAGWARMTLEEPMRNQTTRVTELTFQTYPVLLWNKMSVVQKNAAGKVFRQESYDVSNPTFQYPTDLMSPYGLWMLAPTLELKQGSEKVLLIFMNPWIMARTTAKVDSRETVTVPAGTFACWKIVCTIWASDYFGSKVGALVQPFAPKYTLWLEAAAPHKVIKYRGALGEMPNTTSIIEVRELSSYK